MLKDANADPAPRDSALSKLCLQYLLLVRVVVICGQLAAAIAAHYILATPPSILPVAIVIIALGGFTFFSWRTLQSGIRVSERGILTQLLVDVLGLAVLLLFTGGSANPFASLLLLPVIVAAALLPRRYTWIIAAEAALFYTGLLFVHVHPLYVEVHPPESAQIGHEFTVHVWGMWLGFLLSAMVVAYFVARMGSTLRQHDRALAQAREKALEAGQLVALGSLAAGTAHELGTPLATIAILAKELEHDYESNQTLKEKLQLLRSQVMRCKGILSSMAARSGAAQADAGRPVYLDRYLDDLIGEWRDLHPGLAPRVKRSGPQPAA
ncbi:MAG: histidine kinase dimerization/phospho-acceptor domain-containing protein, partial [Gammaproteobacteria bacterium]